MRASGAAMASRPPLTALKCFAQRVDLVDGCARADEGFVEGDGIVKPDLRIEGQVKHGGAAAGDEEEDQGISLRLLQHGKSSAGCGKRFLIWQRVAAFEVAEPPVALLRQVLCAADAAQTFAALHAIEQNFEHRAGGLAHGDDKDSLELREIDDVGSAAIGKQPLEGVAFEANAPIEGGLDAACLERAGKELGGTGM